MQKIGSITSTADSNGEWTDGNVAAGTPPTLMEAAWFNTIQRELAGVVTGAGLTLDPSNDGQVLTAIKKVLLQVGNNLSEIKSAGTTAQNTARTNLGLGSAAVATVGNGVGQVPSMASFTSGSGWIKFPDGTIIQTGTSVVGPLASPTAISFPIPFTQMGYKVTTSFDQASASSNDCPSFAVSPQAVGWAYFMSSRTNGVNAGCNWIAVGR